MPAEDGFDGRREFASVLSVHRRPHRLASVRPLLAAAASACLLLAGCTPAVEGDDRGFVSAVGLEAIPPDERQAGPRVTGETVEGRPLALADVAGMPVAVNFWASWCGPCAGEAPELQAVAAEYEGRVAVIGVNIKDTRTNAQTFERDLGVTYPSWFDPAAAIAAQFGGIAPEALPSTILLDAEHRVAVRLFGAVTEPQLSSYLDDLLLEA